MGAHAYYDGDGRMDIAVMVASPAGMMIKSGSILPKHAVNKERIKKGQRPANSIWLWGEGHVKCGDSFYKRHHLKGAVISAVDKERL